MFDSALKRLVSCPSLVRIYTPFGQSKGYVLKFDGECFEFRCIESGLTLLLYAEDLVMLEENCS